AERLFHRALDISADFPPLAISYYPNFAYYLGGSREGEARVRRILAEARAVNDVTSILFAQPMLGLIVALPGSFGEALRLMADAAAIGERHAISGLTARALSMIAGTHLDLGDLAGAESFALRAIDLARSGGFLPGVVSSSIDLLCLYARTARLDR